MAKKAKYKVYCYIPNHSFTDTIECREVTIKEGAYTFWEGEYGESNHIISSYPIAFTVIERIKEHDNKA